MKSLEELGISPAPWTASGGHWIEMNGGNTDYDENRVFAIPDTEEAPANARLIAAAPKLYEALRRAVIEECQYCSYFNPNTLACRKTNSDRCFALEWRTVLAKAGGAE